jgi:hypothetical protein
MTDQDVVMSAIEDAHRLLAEYCSAWAACAASDGKALLDRCDVVAAV